MNTKHRLQGEYVYLLMLNPQDALEQSKNDGGNTLGLFSSVSLAEKARDEQISIDDTYEEKDYFIYRMPIQTSTKSVNFGLGYWYL